MSLFIISIACVCASMVLAQQHLIINKPLRSQRPRIARPSREYSWSFSNTTFQTGVDLSLFGGQSSIVHCTASGLPEWLVFSADSFSFTGVVPPAALPSIIPITVTATSDDSRVQDSFELLISSAPEPVLSTPLSSQLVQTNAAISSAFVVNPSSALAPYFSSDSPYHGKAGLRVPPAWSFSIGLEGSTFDQWPLFYSATLTSGDPLPDWIRYDAPSFTFSGTTPIASGQSLEVVLSASDVEGYSTSASDSFWITVAAHELKLRDVTQGIRRNVTLGQEIELYLLDGTVSDPLMGEIFWDALPIPMSGIRSIMVNGTDVPSSDLLNRGYFASSVTLTGNGATLPLQITDTQGFALSTHLQLTPVPSFFDVPSIDTLAGMRMTSLSDRHIVVDLLSTQRATLPLSLFVSPKGRDQLQKGVALLEVSVEPSSSTSLLYFDDITLLSSSSSFGASPTTTPFPNLIRQGVGAARQQVPRVGIRRDDSHPALEVAITAYSSDTRAISRLYFTINLVNETACSSSGPMCLPSSTPSMPVNSRSDGQAKRLGAIVGIVLFCTLVFIFIVMCVIIQRRAGSRTANEKSPLVKSQPYILHPEKRTVDSTANSSDTLENGIGGRLVATESQQNNPMGVTLLRHAGQIRRNSMLSDGDGEKLSTGASTETSGSRYDDESSGLKHVAPRISRTNGEIHHTSGVLDKGASHSSSSVKDKPSASSNWGVVPPSIHGRFPAQGNFFPEVLDTNHSLYIHGGSENIIVPPAPPKATLYSITIDPTTQSSVNFALPRPKNLPSSPLRAIGNKKEWYQHPSDSVPVQNCRQSSDDGGIGFTVGTAVIYPPESRPLGSDVQSNGHIGLAFDAAFEGSCQFHDLSKSLTSRGLGIRNDLPSTPESDPTLATSSVNDGLSSVISKVISHDSSPRPSISQESEESEVGCRPSRNSPETPWRRSDFTRPKSIEPNISTSNLADRHRASVYVDKALREQSSSSRGSTESVALVTTAALAVRSSPGLKLISSPKSPRSIPNLGHGVPLPSSPLNTLGSDDYHTGEASNPRLVQFVHRHRYEPRITEDSDDPTSSGGYSVYQGKREKSQKAVVGGTKGTPPSLWDTVASFGSPKSRSQVPTAESSAPENSLLPHSCSEASNRPSHRSPGAVSPCNLSLINDPSVFMDIEFVGHLSDSSVEPTAQRRERQTSVSDHYLRPPSKSPTRYLDPADSSLSASNSSDPSSDSAVIQHHQGRGRVLVGTHEAFNFPAPLRFPGLPPGNPSRSYIMSLIRGPSDSDQCHLRAEMGQGGDLPRWLTFDAKTAEFWGVPNTGSGKDGMSITVQLCKRAHVQRVAEFVLVVVGH